MDELIPLNATTAELLANIEAMGLAIDGATSAERFGLGQIVAIHRQLIVDESLRRVVSSKTG